MVLSLLSVLTTNVVLLSQTASGKHFSISFKLIHARQEYIPLADLREKKLFFSQNPMTVQWQFNRSIALLWLSACIPLKLLVPLGPLINFLLIWWKFTWNIQLHYSCIASCYLAYSVSLTPTHSEDMQVSSMLLSSHTRCHWQLLPPHQPLQL